MNDDAYELLAADLLERTHDALLRVVSLAAATDITFKLGDVVRLVEDELPDWYPAPTAPDGRSAMVARMAADLLDDMRNPKETD